MEKVHEACVLLSVFFLPDWDMAGNLRFFTDVSLCNAKKCVKKQSILKKCFRASSDILSLYICSLRLFSILSSVLPLCLNTHWFGCFSLESNLYCFKKKKKNQNQCCICLRKGLSWLQANWYVKVIPLWFRCIEGFLSTPEISLRPGGTVVIGSQRSEPWGAA